MNWASGALVFLIIWWTAIFLVLPFGIKRDERGVPVDARMKQKLLLTTVISIILWFVVYILIRMDMIDFRAMSMAMMKQDYGP
jgi:predicted secreted protein